MNHPYMKPAFVMYLTVMLFLALFSNDNKIYAMEDVEPEVEVAEVYKLEMNRANYEKIKNDVLETHSKYVVKPEEFTSDVRLSEVHLEEVDFSSFDPQLVVAKIDVYTDSQEGKQIIDQITVDVNVEFVDTTAPKIELSKTKIEQEEGNPFKAADFVKEVTDNSLGEVDLEIDHLVNASIPGEYEVVYTATDKSGNTTSKTLEVVITKKPVVIVPQVAKASAAAPRSTRKVSPTPASGNAVIDTLNIINANRAALGYAPLSLAGAGEQAAAAVRAAEAAVSNASHYRLDGRHYKTAFTDRGIHHSRVYEILTYSGSTPAAKVAWWMSSSSHRSAIMNPNARYIAIGISGSMYAGLVY